MIYQDFERPSDFISLNDSVKNPGRNGHQDQEHSLAGRNRGQAHAGIDPEVAVCERMELSTTGRFQDDGK